MLNVIANAHAGKGQKDDVFIALAEHDYEIYWTEYLRHAEQLAIEIGNGDSQSTLVVAGGDGTVNEVISGLATLASPPPLGILPLGTGNDLCRSLDIPLDPALAMQVITSGRATKIDLGSLDTGSKTLYFANASAIGFSSAVGEVMEAKDKKIWGALAYVKAGMEAIIDFKPLNATVTLDDDVHQFCAFNFVVANGRYVAGGIPVAPAAIANDGVFDFVAFLGENKLEQLANTPSLVKGEHLGADNIFHARAAKIVIEIEDAIAINLDGELADDPARRLVYTIRPAALSIFTGFTPEAISMINASNQA